MSGLSPTRVLVSDFDGTIARDDFYHVFLSQISPPRCEAVWADYQAGRITHFDALRLIFASAAPGEAALQALLPKLNVEDDFADQVKRLRNQRWDVIVVSAGCRWYIDRVLLARGAHVVVHANPGRVVSGRLVMERPKPHNFSSQETGIDKAAVVRAQLAMNATVAFAGDGNPDLAAALLVPGHLRFARGVLAEELNRRGEPFRPFDRWSEIVSMLLEPTPA